MSQVALDEDDPLRSRLEGYEIEHHCDRLAALLCSKRNEDPKSIGIALEKMSKAEEEILRRTNFAVRGYEVPHIPILMTHPATPRRIQANFEIARHLPRVGIEPDSQLREITDSDLPITRPFGHVISEPNTHRMSIDELSEKEPEIPEEFPDLIKEGLERLRVEGIEAQSWYYSDWFANFWGFLKTDDGEKYKQEFAKEVAKVDRADLAKMLESINLARFIDNCASCDFSGITVSHIYSQSQVPLSEALDQLVDKYVELRPKDTRDLGVLTELVELGERGDRSFGVGAVFFSSAILRLCISVASQGSDEDKRSLSALVDRAPSLQAAIGISNEKETPELKQLIDLLMSDCKTIALRANRDVLERSLEAYTFEKWVGPSLSSRNVGALPVCVRRESGAAFKVSRETFSNGREYELVIVGDNPIGEQELAAINNHLNETIQKELQAMCERHGIKKDAPESNEAELLKLAKNVVTSIQSAVASLQKLTPKSNGEKLAYMADILPQQIEQARRNRTINAINTARFGLETNLRENDLSVRLAIEGNDKVRDDLIGKSRDLFRQTRYMRFEECSTEHIRLQRLWSELHSHHYESIKPGLNKASFLTESYPIKSCYRDQLICKSLELPDLNYLDDMGRISEEIANEESIDILLLLRDTLHSQELAQVAEVRLYELFNRAPTEFLKHPLIVARMADTLKSLPEVLQQLFASNERLLGVGMCFAYASREKDRHLLQFKDSANDRQIKEAFGALLSDPNLASTEGTVLFKKRQDADSLFASMAALAPYDKAQALLYFMGTRGFYSPLYEWFEGYSDEDKDDTASAYGRDRDEVGWVGSTITPLIRQEGSGSFPEPDVLIRAQKAFGMAITTAENLKAGLLKLDLQMN